MRLHGSHRLLSRRHGAVTACVLPPARDRARALSRWDAAEIVRDLGSDASYGDHHALVQLAEALAGWSAGGGGGGRSAACVAGLLEAVATAALVFVPGWHDGGGGGEEPAPAAIGRRAASATTAAKASTAAARAFGRLLVRLAPGGGDFSFEGRSYRLAHAPSQRGSSSRAEGFDVVPRAEARALLERMATRLGRTSDQRAAWREVLALGAGGGREAPAGGRPTLLLLRRRRQPLRLFPSVGEPAHTPSELRAGLSPARARLALVVIDVVSRAPVAGLPLRILGPDGSVHQVRTDGAGQVTIDDLEPGDCDVTSIVAGARIERAYAPTTARAMVPRGGGDSDGEGDRDRDRGGGSGQSGAWLIEEGRHRIATGETGEAIARRWGVPWTEIATFNWGTSDPAALEEPYRFQLGCARRDPETGRYLFDDGDEPGILIVPRPWRRTLRTGPRHQIDVGPLRPLFLRLENELGVALPGAAFHVRFADGHERQGRLGRRGIARLTGVPEGPFAVSYPDQLELLATSLAAAARRGLGEQIAGPVLHLLMQSHDVVARAVATYADHFDDLGGGGLAGDIDLMLTDPAARAPVLALAEMAGLPLGDHRSSAGG